MTDDQGWGDTGYNGHPVLKTPNLHQMAEQGIRFDRFYSGPLSACPLEAVLSRVGIPADTAYSLPTSDT